MLNVLLVISNSSLDKELYDKLPKKYGRLNVVNTIHGIDNIEETNLSMDLDLILLELEAPSQDDVNSLKDKALKKDISVMVVRCSDRDRRKYGTGPGFIEAKLGKIANEIQACGMGDNMRQSLVIIGSSTGGPRALQEIIPKLPSKINASILIVQHMPPRFTKSLADRLNLESAVKVKEAEEGDIVEKGCVYIAPGDFHMVVNRGLGGLVIELHQEEKHKGVRPAVDFLMNSVSKLSTYSKMGIILTGMGSDGAEGIVNMKEANSYNIVQDKESCVVYGMPKAALNTEQVDEIVSLNDISNKIISKVGCNNGFRCESIS